MHETATETTLGQLGGLQAMVGNYPVLANPEYELRVSKALNGYMVYVGCKTVVFESLEKMLKEMERYYKDPQKVQKEYLEKK